MRIYKRIVPVLVAALTLSAFQPAGINFAALRSGTVEAASRRSDSGNGNKMNGNMAAFVSKVQTVSEGAIGIDGPAGSATPGSIAEPAKSATPGSIAEPVKSTTPGSITEPVKSSTPEMELVQQGIVFKIETITTKEEEYSYAVVTEYKGTESAVTIPDTVEKDGTEYPVTEIGTRAFRGKERTEGSESAGGIAKDW